MDRLLQFLLKTFVRRGTFRVTTSRGTVLNFGDGTGQPVSVRFASRAAEWGILLDPELKFGEAYMNGTFVVEQGTIADVLAIMLGQDTDVPHWARLQGMLRYIARRMQPVQSAQARAPQRGASLRSRRPSLFALPRRRPAIFAAPISSSPARPSTTRSWRRNGISPPSCCSTPGQARARHRLRLGRARALSRANRRRRRDRHHAFARANRHRQRARGGKGPGRARRASTCRTTATSKGRSTASSRSACSSMSASITTTPSSARARELLADDGVMLLHSIGRSDGPSRTSPWISKYIFPGRLYPVAVRSAAAIEALRPVATDIEILRLHYAETLKHWRERFLAHREEIARIYDRAFAHVGVLLGLFGNGVPRTESDGDADPAHQAAGRHADDA